MCGLQGEFHVFRMVLEWVFEPAFLSLNLITIQCQTDIFECH